MAQRRIRTRSAAWDLGEHGGLFEEEGLLEGLPMMRPTQRARVAPTPAPAAVDGTTADDGHTTDDASSVASSSASSPTPVEARDALEARAAAGPQVVVGSGGRRRKQRGKVALALGMIRMSDEFMGTYVGPADPLLDLHSARDTRRIWCLERELKTDVISLADARRLPGVDHVKADGEGKHVSCLFENPGLRDLQRALNGRKIGWILGDYIRFPCDYLRKCYDPVVKTLLPALLCSGMLANDCQVYMPYPRRQAGVPNIYADIEEAFAPPAGPTNRQRTRGTTSNTSGSTSGTPRLCTPKENPLYRATKTWFKEDHMHKTEGLTPGTPFLHFALGAHLDTTPGLRRPWW